MATPVVTSKPYKEKAEYNGITIWLNTDNSIEINNSSYSSVKDGLRDIACKSGLSIDPKWNTQQLGKKLIKYLNER